MINTQKQTMTYYSGFKMKYYFEYGGVRWLIKNIAKTVRSACKQHSLALKTRTQI